MKRIYQSIVDRGDGDCQRAAVASILGLTLEQVPHFNRFGPRWFHLLDYFFLFMGWEYQGTRHKSLIVSTEDCIDGFVIATVKSRNYEGITHAVLMNKDWIVEHDPHPKEAFLGVNVKDTDELVTFMSFAPCQKAGRYGMKT